MIFILCTRPAKVSWPSQVFFSEGDQSKTGTAPWLVIIHPITARDFSSLFFLGPAPHFCFNTSCKKKKIIMSAEAPVAATTSASTEKVISAEELAKHTTRNDLWIVVNGKVYDVSKFVDEHPGGEEVLIDVGGKDATREFEDVGHSEDAVDILNNLYVGPADPTVSFKVLLRNKNLVGLFVFLVYGRHCFLGLRSVIVELGIVCMCFDATGHFGGGVYVNS